MTWHEHHCISVTCDVCGDGWADESGQPHFEDRTALEAYATKAGWVITPLRAICAFCTPDEACAAAGHEWGRWKPFGPIARKDRPAWVGRLRICRECSAVQWEPPPTLKDGV